MEIEVFKSGSHWHMVYSSMPLMAYLLERDSLPLEFGSSVPESVVLEDMKRRYPEASVSVRRGVLN